MHHTGVTFYNNQIYTATSYDVYSNGAVIVYGQQGDTWRRVRIIYLPRSSSRTHRLSLGIADDRMYVCNYTAYTVYIFLLDGYLLHEHKNRKCSHLCAVDSSGLLDACYGYATLNALVNGEWRNNAVSGLDKYVRGAVLCDQLLYVASYYKSDGFLQLYSIE